MNEEIAQGRGAFANRGYSEIVDFGVLAKYRRQDIGVWYKDEVCEQYADCCNDDELVLYLSKEPG